MYDKSLLLLTSRVFQCLWFLVMLTACRLRRAMKLHGKDQRCSSQVMLIFSIPAGLMIPVSSGSELSRVDTWLCLWLLVDL